MALMEITLCAFFAAFFGTFAFHQIFAVAQDIQIYVTTPEDLQDAIESIKGMVK